MTVRIALVGDFDPRAVAHRAIPVALELVGRSVRLAVAGEWIGTDTIDARRVSGLERFQGIWCVPASPYRSTEGAIAAIRLARERSIPFLGTCGGFQHAVLECAEGLWGIERPKHAEIEPDAEEPVIAPLACALIEKGGRVRFGPGSKLASAYGRLSADEEYHCSYGLSTACRRRLAAGPLRATAWDEDGDVRAVELDGHPFFVGTLFQPERAALRNEAPPLVRAFIAASAQP
jgi:CTP synthase (UTP-ammonia lyase)